MTNEKSEFLIPQLGKCTVNSPLALSTKMDDFRANFTINGQRIVLNSRVHTSEIEEYKPILLEAAGPRQKLYFDPSKVKAAIVTCGGLCPGLNNVIRGLVLSLWDQYKVKNIVGIQNGYMGFLPEFGIETMELTPKVVDDIHRDGGTILGSSRGYGNRTEDIVDALERMNINMLFTIGGDGTQKGSLAIAREAQKRGIKLSVVGIPKTIDNDLSFVRKSFGFETAVASAVKAVESAAVEAKGAMNGIGVVKLMGRESGFIAAHTALASGEADFVLVPEVPFELDGLHGFLAALEATLKEKGNAVVIVAEGAGQKLLKDFDEKYRDVDASGNRKLGDIGVFMKDLIHDHFKEQHIPATVKYIDPSYIIRSQRANPNDSIYCSRLANNAVHAAMAGKTEVLMGLVHNHYCHVPIERAVSKRNVIDPNSSLWRGVLEATGQPALMMNNQI